MLRGPGRLTASELTEWLAEYEIEPFEELDDCRFGQIASLIYNSNSTGTKLSTKDFAPERRSLPIETEPVSIEAVTTVLTAASGLNVIKGVRG